MKQTAVEWLELSLLGIISFDSEELRAKYRNAITKAKEIENQESKQVGQITEKGIIDTIGNCGNCGVEFHIHKDIGEKQQGYSEEDLVKILLDFVAFPHDHMEPRGSIIDRYLNELNQNNERSPK